jgi:hypothetical protein
MLLYGSLAVVIIGEFLLQIILVAASAGALRSLNSNKKVLFGTLIIGILLSIICVWLFTTLPNPKLTYVGIVMAVSSIGFILTAINANGLLKYLGYSICWMTILTYLVFATLVIITITS